MLSLSRGRVRRRRHSHVRSGRNNTLRLWLLHRVLDLAATVSTRRCQGMNGTLKTVKSMRPPGQSHDKRLIVLISTGFTLRHEAYSFLLKAFLPVCSANSQQIWTGVTRSKGRLIVRR